MTVTSEATRTIDGAEMRAYTERMGLSVTWLAREWGVAEGTIKRWMKGSNPIPAWVAEDIAEMVTTTEQALRDMIAAAAEDADRPLLTYRNDREYEDDGAANDGAFNAAWHRMLCSRVAEHVPGVRLRYAVPPRDNPRD